jgi:hypothetical protein
MQIANRLLNAATHFSGQLGPITALLDTVADRMVPTATVQACHGSNIFCASACGTASFCRTGRIFLVWFAKPTETCTSPNRICGMCDGC